MIQGIAKKVTLPVFTLTEICSKEDCNAVNSMDSGSKLEYYSKPIVNHYGENMSFNSVELVLCGDGSPWVDACLYLLEKITDNYSERHVLLSSNTASDLAKYRAFIEEYDINYLDFPKQKMKRPTYRYRAHLKSMIRSGEIAISTAQRFMQSIISFYRWLKAERRFNPSYAMWNESDVYINYEDSVGFSKSKIVKTTDIKIKGKAGSATLDTFIMDSGRLKPMSVNEQIVLVESLIALDNVEMTLNILIALFSGARIQTVLTLKVRHFNVDLPAGLEEVRLNCGPGTFIDTKHDKKMCIAFPRWLHDIISNYVFSENAVKKRLKWKDKKKNQTSAVSNDDAYVFLSNRGTPFYEDSIDRNKFNLHQKGTSRPSGGVVRTFMADRLLPLMRETLGANFSFKYHDLRATFGMNLTDALINRMELGQLNLTQVRNEVRDRMGHTSYTTTDNYLGYREKSRVVKLTQTAYEQHLKSLSATIMRSVNGF
jgi:hypothetical protein